MLYQYNWFVTIPAQMYRSPYAYLVYSTQNSCYVTLVSIVDASALSNGILLVWRGFPLCAPCIRKIKAWKKFRQIRVWTHPYFSKYALYHLFGKVEASLSVEAVIYYPSIPFNATMIRMEWLCLSRKASVYLPLLRLFLWYRMLVWCILSYNDATMSTTKTSNIYILRGSHNPTTQLSPRISVSTPISYS